MNSWGNSSWSSPQAAAAESSDPEEGDGVAVGGVEAEGGGVCVTSSGALSGELEQAAVITSMATDTTGGSRQAIFFITSTAARPYCSGQTHGPCSHQARSFRLMHTPPNSRTGLCGSRMHPCTPWRLFMSQCRIETMNLSKIQHMIHSASENSIDTCS